MTLISPDRYTYEHRADASTIVKQQSRCYAVECCRGGATFDASLRFPEKDPWKDFVNFVTVSKTQSFRCCSVDRTSLGYRPYADDVVEVFVPEITANGIDIIRIFDCMNDLRNLQTAA